MDQQTTTKQYNIAFVEACWHFDIVDQCRRGFVEELTRQGWSENNCQIYHVPGSFDIPLMVKKLAQSGRFEAVVAAGLIVDGGIYRHDFVSSAVIDGLMQVQLETGVPVISAVLTPHHFQEHKAHLKFFADHFVTKGIEAADACLKILENVRPFSTTRNIDLLATQSA